MKILKTTALTAIALIALLVAGCEKPTKLSSKAVNEASMSMSYFKDSHGLCYAILGSRTYAGYFSNSITLVPCEKVGLNN